METGDMETGYIIDLVFYEKMNLFKSVKMLTEKPCTIENLYTFL